MDQYMPARQPFALPDAFLEPRMPSIAFRFGRGRTGGTTKLDIDIQFARAAGRTVIVGDGDRRNPTLSTLYPTGAKGGALPPPVTDETADVKDWITSSIGEAISRQQSLLVDMSGGDCQIASNSDPRFAPNRNPYCGEELDAERLVFL